MQSSTKMLKAGLLGKKVLQVSRCVGIYGGEVLGHSYALKVIVLNQDLVHIQTYPMFSLISAWSFQMDNYRL